MNTTTSSIASPGLDNETHQLAAMVYGEASVQNNADEMYALASVLVRQRDARGYSDIGTFASSEPTFSFVVSDGNKRYKNLMAANEKEIEASPGMKTALEAAKNALTGGPDKSNGAYFWDGADIKTNYDNHYKVRNGIKFTDPSHNIYGIKESTRLIIKTKTVKIKNKKTGKVTTKEEELYRFDHKYESTAAYGGTIFWKLAPDYVQKTHSKEYK